MALSDLKIKGAKKPDKAYKLSDSGGLYILIETTGGKLWRFDYRFEGKRKTLALGRYPDISLQEARDRHQEARNKLANGIDPAAFKKAQKAAGKERIANSFEAIAHEWIERWKTDKVENHHTKTLSLLRKDIFPYIGGRPVAEITAPDVLNVLRRAEERGAITKRTRQKALSQWSCVTPYRRRGRRATHVRTFAGRFRRIAAYTWRISCRTADS
jgi:hypothetical protein